MPPGSDVPELTVTDAAAWRDWLGANHDESPGVWLVLAKKGTTAPTSLSYGEALEEALCHGWIDGQRRGLDAAVYLQRFTPRRSRSAWSRRNVAIVEGLTAAGRMQENGLAEVERAKGDGRWAAAYAGPADRHVPDDLTAALADEPRAEAMFDILTSQNRFAIIHRVEEAKRAETRANRIAQFVAMLAGGETIYPQARTLDE